MAVRKEDKMANLEAGNTGDSPLDVQREGDLHAPFVYDVTGTMPGIQNAVDSAGVELALEVETTPGKPYTGLSYKNVVL